MKDLLISFQSQAGQLAYSIFASLPVSRIISLTVISALLGILFVYLYSFISFQSALAKVKKKIFAAAMEPFLFRDSLLLSITSPLRIFALGFKYLALCLPPLVILAVPMLWLLGFLNQGYGYGDLAAGDRIFISISAEGAREIRPLELESDLKGAEVSALVKSPVRAEAYAELRVNENNPSGFLKLKGAKDSLEIPLPEHRFALPVFTEVAWKKLLFPGARYNLPAGIKDIEFQYPAAHYEIFSVRLHWLILFFVVSVFSGLIFAKYAGVEV